MESRSDQAAGAIFLIGLGLLFITGWWWPGILFVIAASSIARAISSGRHWASDRGALCLLTIGFIFMFHLNWGFIWILIGLGLLAAYMMRNNDSGTKHKNDDFDDFV